jgi:hypothetical protein
MQQQALSLIAVFLFLGLPLPMESQNSVPPDQEQSSFGGEEVPGVPFIKRPVSVPDSVLQILKADKIVKSCSGDNVPNPEAPFGSWFVASEVHLDGPKQRDLIVLPSPGAHQPNYVCFHSVGSFGWFWVFRQTDERYQLVLKTMSFGIGVAKTRHLGYRDIRTVSPSAAGKFITTVTFGFDGKSYQEYGRKIRESQP